MVSEQLAGWLVAASGVYVGLGIFFAVAFVLVGIRRIDPAAEGAGWGFRLLILPGSLALWPLLLLRWIGGSGPPVEQNAHRAAARRRR